MIKWTRYVPSSPHHFAVVGNLIDCFRSRATIFPSSWVCFGSRKKLSISSSSSTAACHRRNTARVLSVGCGSASCGAGSSSVETRAGILLIGSSNVGKRTLLSHQDHPILRLWAFL
ncbi:unnamed protein product [Musa textilis]